MSVRIRVVAKIIPVPLLLCHVLVLELNFRVRFSSTWKAVVRSCISERDRQEKKKKTKIKRGARTTPSSHHLSFWWCECCACETNGYLPTCEQVSSHASGWLRVEDTTSNRDPAGLFLCDWTLFFAILSPLWPNLRSHQASSSSQPHSHHFQYKHHSHILTMGGSNEVVNLAGYGSANNIKTRRNMNGAMSTNIHLPCSTARVSTMEQAHRVSEPKETSRKCKPKNISTLDRSRPPVWNKPARNTLGSWNGPDANSDIGSKLQPKHREELGELHRDVPQASLTHETSDSSTRSCGEAWSNNPDFPFYEIPECMFAPPEPWKRGDRVEGTKPGGK